MTSPGDSSTLSQCSYIWPAGLRNLYSQTFILEMLVVITSAKIRNKRQSLLKLKIFSVYRTSVQNSPVHNCLYRWRFSVGPHTIFCDFWHNVDFFDCTKVGTCSLYRKISLLLCESKGRLKTPTFCGNNDPLSANVGQQVADFLQCRKTLAGKQLKSTWFVVKCPRKAVC